MLKAKRVLLLVILMVLPFRLYGVTNPLIDQPIFRQAQTATVVKNFYQNGIDLFKTELDLFGLGKEKYLTLEFPLYEAIVTVIYKLTFYNVIWGRIVSIVAGFLGAFYLYKLVKLLLNNNKAAFFSSLFFLFAPLNLIYQRAYLLEATVIAFLIAGLYYYSLWSNTHKWQHFLLGIILLSFGFMQKGAYGPFWLLPMVVYYISKNRFKKIFNFQFILIILCPLLFGLLWQKHTEIINIENGHTYFSLSDKSYFEWNFGVWSDRFNYKMLDQRISQVIQGITLKPGLVFFLIGIVTSFKYSNNLFLYSWLIAEIIYFLTFFRIQSHNYYQMVLIPVFSIFMSIGLITISNLFDKLIYPKIKKIISARLFRAIILTLFFSFYMVRTFMHARWDFVIDRKWQQRMVDAGNSLPANSYGILVNAGYDWDSVYSYYINRKMFLIDAGELNKDKILKLQKEGYSFLILHDFANYQFLFKDPVFMDAMDLISKYPIVYDSEDFRVYLFK